eukprot:6750258-Alexandrium_andersonii.AAC.1
MSASLVGSEMCIRDRLPTAPTQLPRWATNVAPWTGGHTAHGMTLGGGICLLYTSDAADDM